MLRMGRLLLLIPVLYGCDFGGPTSMLVRHGDCGLIDGVLSLAWTIRGATPSAASCQGIDHLSVDIDNDLCGATISPVPCVLDKWRYDNMPEGSVNIAISALDRSGATVAAGYTVVDLGPAPPPSPAPINLQ
jgi:hypothetical protein